MGCSWGGTPADTGTPASAFSADESLKDTNDHPHAIGVT